MDDFLDFWPIINNRQSFRQLYSALNNFPVSIRKRCSHFVRHETPKPNEILPAAKMQGTAAILMTQKKTDSVKEERQRHERKPKVGN